jgi:hypothetical protein
MRIRGESGERSYRYGSNGSENIACVLELATEIQKKEERETRVK